MNKYYIQVDEGIHYLGEKPGFFKQFDGIGNCMVDKVITGCGATTEALSDDVPTILCSPRNALLECKAEADQFKGKVYLFRDSDAIAEHVKPIELENRLRDYLQSFNSPFVSGVPKILVCYDSFRHVAQLLRKTNDFHKFRIVVDEAQALFGDSAFKPEVEIQFLESVCKSNHVIFLSAKPYVEDLLDICKYFQNLPYYQLVWPQSALQPTNIDIRDYGSKTITETVAEIIRRYNTNNYFECKILDGSVYYATEAVFFLNHVADIISIIKKNGLTPDNTNIICGDNPDNASRLAKITDDLKRRLGFNIGKAPKKGEPHKTFTFVTKCSFEGTDFYSPNAYTYIFSDAVSPNMALDVSLDLRQIMGRQRLFQNVFRYDATFYYRPDPKLKAMSFEDFKTYLDNKTTVSEDWIENYNGLSHKPGLQKNMLKDKAKVQKADHFSEDYVAAVINPTTEQAEPVLNELAKCNEIRAWQIQQTQYLTSYQVLRAVGEVTVHDVDYPLTEEFRQRLTGKFKNIMFNYCDILSVHPEYKRKLETLPQIPLEIKNYYNTLGPEIIKKCGYSEKVIKEYLHMDITEDEIRDAVRSWFAPGKRYTLIEVKDELQKIFDYYGKTDHKASASDLKDYLPGGYEGTYITLNGKRHKGYRIL